MLDKVARLKPVRRIFYTIRAWDQQPANWANVRHKIPNMLKMAGVLFRPSVPYSFLAYLVSLRGASENHPFAPETGTCVLFVVGIAFGVLCLWFLPISLKVRIWITLPYIPVHTAFWVIVTVVLCFCKHDVLRFLTNGHLGLDSALRQSSGSTNFKLLYQITNLAQRLSRFGNHAGQPEDWFNPAIVFDGGSMYPARRAGFAWQCRMASPTPSNPGRAQ